MNSKEVQVLTGIGCKQSGRAFSAGFAAFALFLGLVLPPEVDITGEWRGERVGTIPDPER